MWQFIINCKRKCVLEESHLSLLLSHCCFIEPRHYTQFYQSIINSKLNKLRDNMTHVVCVCVCHWRVSYWRVQGHQWFTDTMEIDAKAHGQPLGQVFNLIEILPAVELRQHLWEQLSTHKHNVMQTSTCKNFFPYMAHNQHHTPYFSDAEEKTLSKNL